MTPESLHRREPGLRNRDMLVARGCCVLLLAGVLSLMLDAVLRQALGRSPWVSGLLTAACFALAWWADRWLARKPWWYGRAVLVGHARLVLRRGGCPVCWYDLRTIKPEADGCRTCPECGAAWRLEQPRPATAGPA